MYLSSVPQKLGTASFANLSTAGMNAFTREPPSTHRRLVSAGA
jgi:hypothetical protein